MELDEEWTTARYSQTQHWLLCREGVAMVVLLRSEHHSTFRWGGRLADPNWYILVQFKLSHQIPSSWCVSVFGFGLSVWNWTLDFGRWDFQLAISMLDIRALGIFRKKRGGCEVDELNIY
jgi:hypothetical protein